MFETDIERIKACILYEDYYSAMEYAILVKDKYENKEKEYFENVIKLVKQGKLYWKYHLSTNILDIKKLPFYIFGTFLY